MLDGENHTDLFQSCRSEFMQVLYACDDVEILISLLAPKFWAPGLRLW